MNEARCLKPFCYQHWADELAVDIPVAMGDEPEDDEDGVEIDRSERDPLLGRRD